MAIADTIVVMNDGFIEDMGKPERIYLRPATRFTANFMGESNFVDGRVSQSEANTVTVDTPLGKILLNEKSETGASVSLAIRPEHFKTERQGNCRPLGTATVLESGFFGTHHQCIATVKGLDNTIKVRLPQKEIIAPGTVIDLFVDPADIVMLSR